MGLLKIFQQNLHIYHKNDFTSLCTIHFIYILVLEDVIGSDVGDDFYWPTLYSVTDRGRRDEGDDCLSFLCWKKLTTWLTVHIYGQCLKCKFGGPRYWRYWPQRTRFYFWGFLRLCQFWWRSIKKCDRGVSTDGHTDTHTDANRFYNLSHAICYSYGTDKYPSHNHAIE